MILKAWAEIPGFDPVKEQYVELDLDKWLKDHDIEDKGQAQGGRNQPATTDDTLDAVEAQIVDWVNERGLQCRGEVAGHLLDLGRELVDIEDDPELAIVENNVDHLSGEAELQLERGIDDGRTDLTDKENAVRTGSAELARFQRRAGLTRLPDYSGRAQAGWFILSCFLVEVVLNATLLMEANPWGLLGSAMLMLLISAVNVLAAGFFMAALCRQCCHAATWHKACALPASVVLILLVFLFNLAVGHFRDSVLASVNDPAADLLAVGNDTLQRLWDGPLELAFQSVLLFLLGVVAFIIGAWKWCRFDDIYPGYGRLDRQLKDVKDDYANAYRREQDKLFDIYERSRDKLQDIQHKLVVKKSRWKDICLRGNRLVREYVLHLSQYQHHLDYLLAAYRTANKEARSTPPPEHFNCRVLVDRQILDQPPEFHPPPETSLVGVTQKVDRAIRRLQEAHLDARRGYATLDALTRQGQEEAQGAPP